MVDTLNRLERMLLFRIGSNSYLFFGIITNEEKWLRLNSDHHEQFP